MRKSPGKLAGNVVAFGNGMPRPPQRDFLGEFRNPIPAHQPRPDAFVDQRNEPLNRDDRWDPRGLCRQKVGFLGPVRMDQIRTLSPHRPGQADLVEPEQGCGTQAVRSCHVVDRDPFDLHFAVPARTSNLDNKPGVDPRFCPLRKRQIQYPSPGMERHPSEIRVPGKKRKVADMDDEHPWVLTQGRKRSNTNHRGGSRLSLLSSPQAGFPVSGTAMPEFQPSFAIFQDWSANRGNPKGRLIMVAFRIAYFLRNYNRLTCLFGIPYLLFYRGVFDWLMCVELPHKTRIGSGLQIHHGHALVVQDSSVLGNHCVLRHSTTLGNKRLPDGTVSAAPRLGNHVDVGAGACLIGPITIGDGAVIGAGSVVTKDVPPRAVVAGNPARVIRILE